MKNINLLILTTVTLFCFGCVPLDKISRHDFDSGYFKLKTPEGNSSDVYVDLQEDSITVFPFNRVRKAKIPDLTSFQGACIDDVKPGGFLYDCTFIRNSLDLDLSTVVTKYRFATSNVPNQLNANVNAALYLGARRDYFIIHSHNTPTGSIKTHMRQFGFDAGFFAGIGLTPVNPTVTRLDVLLEYDGIVFQKGVSVFFTIEKLSLGLALGFDNLLDKNSDVWIYNQKPWIGLVLGIANF